MKLKLIITGLAGLTASCLYAGAQTYSPGIDKNQSAPAVTTPAATPAPAAETPTPATAAPAPAAAAAMDTPVLAKTEAPAASAQDAPPTPAAATTTNAATIDRISMDDVPLTTAIKTFARQANINIMLDPHIPYGTVAPDGHTNADPPVSIHWENLTADQALNAVLNNYDLTLVPDSKTGIARITVKDKAAPDPLVTKTIQLKYADPTNIVLSLATALRDPRSRVFPDTRTSQLVVLATEKEMETLGQLVAQLDTANKQVLIEAKLVELSKNPNSARGVDWSGTLLAQHATFGNNVAGGQSGYPYSTALSQTTIQSVVNPGLTNAATVPNSLVNVITYGANNTVGTPGLLASTSHGLDPSTAFLNADGVSAVFSFLNSEADAKVLSTPRAVTLDNQEATLSVTTAQPIFATTAGTQGSPGGSQVTYTNLGTILKVTPRISANDMINLKVIPEVSDLGGTITKTVSGQVNQADFFDIRRIETRVMIPSGNTLVMGGLLSDNSTKGNTKVPFFGDIPVLGSLFRSETKNQNKKSLMIFITPTVVKDESFQPTQTGVDFLKTKATDGPSDGFGAWDKATPEDWSKLIGTKKSTNDDDWMTQGSGK